MNGLPRNKFGVNCATGDAMKPNAGIKKNIIYLTEHIPFFEYINGCRNKANDMQNQYQRRINNTLWILYTARNNHVLIIYFFIEKFFPVYHVRGKKIRLYFLE